MKAKSIRATREAAQENDACNRLYYGNNLDVLRRKIDSESVDLCYIDPPFNSKRNYFQIYNNIGHEDSAQAQAFEDTWEWGDEAVQGAEYILDVENLNDGRVTEQTVSLIRGLMTVLGHGAMMAYLIHMTLRIVEIHRVLRRTGSLYLHCDPTASHYLKIICDSVFCAGGGEFQNEIVWCYSIGGKGKRRFARKHDVILYYTKSSKDDHTFNAKGASIPRKPNSHMKVGIDEEGREYQEKRDRRSGKVYRYYLDEGKIAEDYWTDIETLNRDDQERLGYPTQKPEALLERIIKTGSNEGEVVLDAYCGCGTTVAVAQRLNRRWIGIDVTYQSISLILKRLEEAYREKWPQIEQTVMLDGVPRDIESARALAHRKDDKTRKEFEKWAVLTYSSNHARINEKKGADGGVDGVAYFHIDKERSGKAIFQVKSGGANRATVATLNSDRLREKAEFGVLIVMDEPSKPMREEAREAGRYRHPLLAREDERIQIVTVADILAGKRLDLPMGRRDIVKAAEALGGEQMDLM